MPARLSRTNDHAMRIFSIVSVHVPLHALEMPMSGPRCALSFDCGPRRMEGSNESANCQAEPLPCPARSNADFSQQMKTTLAAGGLLLTTKRNRWQFPKAWRRTGGG